MNPSSPSGNPIPPPGRLFAVTVLVLIVSALLTESFVHYLPFFHDTGGAIQTITESLILFIFFAPLLYWSIIRPLRSVAERSSISERIAQRSLSETVSLLEATLEATADGIIALSSDKEIVIFNNKYREMWDIPAHLLQERDPWKVMDFIYDLLEDPEGFKEHSIKVYSDPESVYFDTVRLKDGRIFERYSQPQKIGGSIVGRVSSYRDVTERVTIMRNLSESEAQFRQLFEQNEDALFIFDGEMKTTIDTNPAAERMFPVTCGERTSLPPLFFLTGDEIAQVRRQLLDPPAAGSFWVEGHTFTAPDASERSISIRGRRMYLRGQPAILCTINDITEKVRLDEQARAIQAKLIHANKMTSLGVLVSGIAHEINNPNNYIMVSAELLTRAWKDSRSILNDYFDQHGDFMLGGVPYSSMKQDISELFENILEGSQRIRDIVSSLKNFARDGKAGIRPDVDMNKVVNQAITIINHHITRHTSRFSFIPDADLPPVSGNIQQIEQIIINLILNATQAVSSRDQAIRVITRHDREHGRVCVDICDEGMGIAPEIAGKVMQPFFTTRLDSGGTGLGLSISQAIAEDHDGSLTFSSTPSKGTVFCLALPAMDSTSTGGNL